MTASEFTDFLKENGDEAESVKMSAYMRDMFPFFGIPKPKLTALSKDFLSERRKLPLDWELVNELWNTDFREAQYVALMYIDKHKKELVTDDMEMLEKLITTKSWWETVDQLDGYVGLIVEKDSSLKERMLELSVSDNMWLRRVAIDFQQKYKENTDTEILKTVILNNLGSKEFFINKAIGWSLREYSKTNPAWAKSFIDTYGDKLDKLSIKEGSKYL